MKKALIFGVALAFLCTTGLVSMSMAEDDKGAADIPLESTIDSVTKADPPKKAKPAIFPHAKHQEFLKCADCHHSKDAEGKKVDYAEGQKVEKCESCHNKGAGMANAKLATFKGAAHANCQTCHKAEAKKDEAKKALSKCTTCHPKKK